jgi:hypothetical protein
MIQITIIFHDIDHIDYRNKPLYSIYQTISDFTYCEGLKVKVFSIQVFKYTVHRKLTTGDVFAYI